MACLRACSSRKQTSSTSARIKRRSLLASIGALPVAAAVPRWAGANEAEITVGYIYLGSRRDYGYNQAHALAARQIAQLAGVRVVEQENVAETDAAASAMEAMIVQEGASVIFATSFGYFDPYVLDLAARYPAVRFQHCGGLWRADKHPTNVGSYFGRMHEAQYLAGIVAGNITSELGFVASNRYPGVVRNINSFALGARLANPAASVRVIFTGSWSDPVREAEAVNVLADAGAGALGCSVDSARSVVQAAGQRSLPACGYNASLAELGMPNYLASAVADWSSVVVPMVKQLQRGSQPANSFVGGLREGVVRLGTPGDAAPESSLLQAQDITAEISAGEHWIWSGPLADNAGNTVLEAGERFSHDDIELRKMNWFVQGVLA